MTSDDTEVRTATLVSRAAEGDAGAQDELMRQHLPGLRAFVRMRLGARLRSRETSMDLVQSVCGEVLRDIQDFEYRGQGSFRHWLYGCAENKLRKLDRFWKRQRRDPQREERLDGGDEATLVLKELGDFCTPSRDAMAREELERIETAFGELSEDQQQVILLSRVVGLPHAAVAKELGRTPTATRSLLSRALARLAVLLESP